MSQRTPGRRMLIGSGHTEATQIERAFAAELLAPAAEIKQALALGLDDLEVIAERFAVSTAVIEHQIENRLSRD